MTEDKVTSKKRIRAILEVLKKNSPIEKSALDQRVASYLDVSVGLIYKSTYRDLTELERDGEIDRIHKDKSGRVIENYDPKTNKNSIMEIRLRGQEYLIKGQASLVNKCGDLIVSPNKKNSVYFDSIVRDVINETIISVVVGDSFERIHIINNEMPLKVILARKTSKSKEKIQQILEEKFGKRILVLFLPQKELSGIDAVKAKYGHCMIEFDEGSIRISDLGSKNGTQILSIQTKGEDIEKLEKQYLSPEATISSAISKKDKPNLNVKAIDAAPVTIVGPTLVLVHGLPKILIKPY